MSGLSTIYYGKKYQSVFSSSSRKRANVVAHSILLRLKDDMDVKEKVVVLLEHVKIPYDKTAAVGMLYLVNTPYSKERGF